MNLIIDNVTKKYKDTAVLQGFSAEFKENKITCILGKSGSGKTTILNCISGITDFSGKISGADSLSYMFQNERLISGLTVYNNLEYVLKAIITDKEKRRERIFSILKTVELYEKRDSYPGELSGGMQQRVSMARAFVYPSNVLLMDEPFKSLDIALKSRLIKAFLELWEKNMRTVIFVTHDIDEAVLLSDEINIIGSLPAEITDIFNLPQKQGQRKLNSPEISEIRNNIYEIISKQ